MITDLGTTFAPSQDPTVKPPVSPVQSAVQLISTNLPRVFGAPTPVNPALLAGAGGVHPAIASAVVRSVLAAIFGPNGVPGVGAPSAPGAGADPESQLLARSVGSAVPGGTPPNPTISLTNPTPGPQVPRPPVTSMIPSPTEPSAPLAPPPVPAAGPSPAPTGPFANPGFGGMGRV